MAELHPDLAPYVVDDAHGSRLFHPLVFGTLAFEGAVELMNATYDAKRRALAEAERDGDWRTYVLLHERPYRLDALQDVTAEGDEYAQIVRLVWILSDDISPNDKLWRDTLPSPGTPFSEALMTPHERQALAALPDPVSVFRGYSIDEGARGLSWTTDRRRAEWFGRRFAALGATARVSVGRVAKERIIAYFLGRDEDEVVVLPEDVTVTETYNVTT